MAKKLQNILKETKSKSGFVSREKVCKVLLKTQPKIDLLHDLMGCGRFADVIETSDGFFLGMKQGDIGYNEFLGQPSEEAKRRTRELFNKLPENIQGDIIFILVNKQIRLKDIGLKD